MKKRCNAERGTSS